MPRICMQFALFCQLLLLTYHQVTTLVDLHPFNGARNCSRAERWSEAGVNAILMGLPPVGFAFGIRALMGFGVVYYFVLLAIEMIIWWLPYLRDLSGRRRRVYNWFLSFATLNFERGDTLAHWVAAHQRIHRGTLGYLPARAGRPVPNLEHTILHAWTLVTAVATAIAFCNGR